MAIFTLVPGAGGVAWYWHRVVPLLEQAKHEAIAVDLPGDDVQAGLSVYAQRVLEAIGTREVILVAQSLAGFTAPLVCAKARVRVLVFVNAMIPVPGETAGGVVGEHRLGGSADRRGAPRWLQRELRSRHLLPARPSA
jgi:pimeloyl-ACP methyl ester carboxylesterase